jgi:YhcH/YjgK/YiaL family protein
MIFSNLAYEARYRDLSPRFALAFDFLKSFDGNLAPGKVIISGDEVYAMIQAYDTSLALDRSWEAHRIYADVQFVYSGEELIYYSPLKELESIKAYDAVGDYELFRGSDRYCDHLSANDFAIFFPEDGHKPGCSVCDSKTVRKVVVKVKVAG